MIEPKYLVISPTEDGETFVQVLTKGELEKSIADDNSDDVREDRRPVYLSEPPSNDTAYWPERSVLITRYIPVVPTPRETVTKWEVE